jgi:hypothetical protein
VQFTFSGPFATAEPLHLLNQLPGDSIGQLSRMKRLKQAEIVPEEFGLASKSVRQNTILQRDLEPRTCETDIEIVIYRCMGWLHLHPASRPMSLEQLWLAVAQMCSCTYIVDPKVILFHLILNNYLCLDGEGDGQTVNVSTANRCDCDGLRMRSSSFPFVVVFLSFFFRLVCLVFVCLISFPRTIDLLLTL